MVHAACWAVSVCVGHQHDDMGQVAMAWTNRGLDFGHDFGA